jgi:hypothetical protein
MKPPEQDSGTGDKPTREKRTKNGRGEMKVKKKWLLVAVSSLLTFALMVGCSSGGSNPTDSSPDTNTEAPGTSELPTAPSTENGGTTDGSQGGAGTSGSTDTSTDTNTSSEGTGK